MFGVAHTSPRSQCIFGCMGDGEVQSVWETLREEYAAARAEYEAAKSVIAEWLDAGNNQIKAVAAAEFLAADHARQRLIAVRRRISKLLPYLLENETRLWVYNLPEMSGNEQRLDLR
jgi:hypothetical protein